MHCVRVVERLTSKKPTAGRYCQCAPSLTALGGLVAATAVRTCMLVPALCVPTLSIIPVTAHLSVGWLGGPCGGG